MLVLMTILEAADNVILLRERIYYLENFCE